MSAEKGCLSLRGSFRLEVDLGLQNSTDVFEKSQSHAHLFYLCRMKAVAFDDVLHVCI